MEATLERPPIPIRRANRGWSDAIYDVQPKSIASKTTAVPPVPPITPVAVPVPVPTTPEARRRPPAFFNTTSKKRRDKAPSTSSPEVISSLIDSLSDISFPEHNHPATPARTNGADSSPATPLLRSKPSFGAGSAGTGGIGMDYDTYRRALSEDFIQPDDAAEPPVIRTAKRPSGLSELTAPRKTHQHALGTYLRSQYARSTSALSSHSRDEDSKSIGNASVETTVRRRSTASTSRDSLDSRMSHKKSQKDLRSPKKDRFKSNEVDHQKEVSMNGMGVSEQLYNPDDHRLSPRRVNHPFDAPIEEEPSFPVAIARISAPSIRDGKRPMAPEGNLDISLASGPAVPSRRSSLRHQDVPTPKATQSSTTQQIKSRSLPEEEEGQSARVANALDGPDTDVTKRIKELKARKELREREARQSPPPPESQNGSYPETSFSSNSPSLAPLRQFSDDNRSTAKLLRIAQLGPVYVPAPGPLMETPKTAASRNLTPTKRPTTPLTPTALPINYSYIVQTLDRDSSPTGKASSTTGSITPSVTPSPDPSVVQQKHKSFAIGGRSAVSRTAVAQNLVSETNSNSNDDADQNIPKPTTEDALSNGRQSTETISTTDGTPNKLKKSGSLKSKRRRWSHPDLPLGVERRLSVRASDLAVGPPDRPEKIVEERPSSADSVDQEVNTFIHAPRLSQKIRHPTSGRTIAFSEVGDPKGHAVFCCVGMGLTRYVTAFYDELAMTLRLRLITPDRPGVGGSQSDPNGTPLSWPDDVLTICQALYISKFSIMAHSAGAIYALATALRMPQHIRGRVHLLAPWIPPSQMAPIGITKQDPPPGAQLPKSQRFLRVLPAPFLKVANTGFLSAASASLNPNGTNSPRREKKRKSLLSKEAKEASRNDSRNSSPARVSNIHLREPPGGAVRRESIMLMDQQNMPDGTRLLTSKSMRNLQSPHAIGLQDQSKHQSLRSLEEDIARRDEYDSKLTLAIWGLATTNANPAIDLLICLERNQPIGFMYKDITRAVTIHHGSKDTRVPVENVKWLGSAMRRCEVRVLEGEGHGLMASAGVMGSVLEEVGREWRDWEEAVRKGERSLGNSRRASPKRKE